MLWVMNKWTHTHSKNRELPFLFFAILATFCKPVLRADILMPDSLPVESRDCATTSTS